MFKILKPKIITTIVAVLLMTIVKKANANVNAIDFTKVNYPAQLQPQIDFLKENVALYDHWAHDWNSTITKEDAIKKLTALYSELDKISKKTIETDLLMGDVAGFLYNMDIEEYYQKAVDNYVAAKNVNPNDYRVYWFLANHYALSNQQVLSIQTYNIAMQNFPKDVVSASFWSNYAVACINANMLGTAKYAAHQSDLILNKVTPIESQIDEIIKNTLKCPPTDTTIIAKDLWQANNTSPMKVVFTSYVLGTKFEVGGDWQLDVGGYKNRTSYITMKPESITAPNGRKIDYSMLMLIQAPDNGQTLSQFMDKFTSRYKNRQPIAFNVGNIRNCMAYEITDATMYSDIGGGHLYAIAVESNKGEYAGMALDMPKEIPKEGAGNVTYYRAQQRYTRLNGKLYYLFLLDSCGIYTTNH